MLPQPPTSFVGRERELAEAQSLLAGSRLLTLTGPGGAGKTRLAIELARRSAADFSGGTSFVRLAAVRDPALVPVEVAGSLGLQDSRGTALLDHLSANLSGRELLLVLDNMEQVLEAGGFVADLLAATDAVRIVVTSRAPLHVAWEQELPVPPLSEAVQLFAARAAASVPGFSLTAGHAATVGKIAERLDGLPLAIELAAARVRVLPPEAILERLHDSLAFLVSNSRDVRGRQRTLRATIAWSHELLSEPARRLFLVCSVFRGGIDLTALEEVCSASGAGSSLLDPVTELVDHSLLRRADRGKAPRFAMLETVREFAAELLADGQEELVTRGAHAQVFWRLVEHLPRPPAAPNRAGLDLLELEHDNIRAALDHLSATDPGTALRMANRLSGFWSIRGYFSEGRRRLAALRDLVPDLDHEWLDALTCEAWLATDQGDRTAALPLLERAVERARAAGDQAREAEALLCRGRIRGITGDPAGFGDDIERSLALREASGDPAGLAGALWLAGAAAHYQGDGLLAMQRLERSVALSAEVGLSVIRARALQLLGVVRLDNDDISGAKVALAEALPEVLDLGDRFAVPIGLSGLAGLAARHGRPRSALRLSGAAAAYEQVNQTNRPQFMRSTLDRWLAPVVAQVGPAAGRLQDEGREMPLDEAIAAGLDPRPEDPWHVGTSPGLTDREREIAVLVARGMANREIAEQLVLSVRTVETHVGRVLTKLGLRTRGQLTAWAHQEGLMADVRGDVT
ncbi:ATP-binding protein [Nocardioides bizhenqiangii]|uniref:LuxR C-terminal-related transcriptional regulator n=1 Tax=Nocardioides bizhenqiangii TaxID=3095076 RepID=A0ABZ0ZQZ4_9ACTN|nr:LuxR C-terminal-related transcriptional regulator [Nocardioides sp. HM61]WQQ26726.1 LuxR C-terminal-related transcriptional regulator [Nocardioides sp. HM61]